MRELDHPDAGKRDHHRPLKRGTCLFRNARNPSR
jgi:hypothetical protein